MWTYQARVRRVVDADTLDLAVDLGFGVTVDVAIRVLGVDAPERNTAPGRAASRFAEGMFGTAPQVTVRTEYDRTFARYLGEIILGDGRDYGEVLIAAGHGTAHRS